MRQAAEDIPRTRTTGALGVPAGLGSFLGCSHSFMSVRPALLRRDRS